MELVHIVICAGKLILENTGYFYWSCNFIVCQSMQPSTLSYSTDLEGQRNDNQMVSVTHTAHLVACETKLQNTLPLLYMSLNRNSVYCIMSRP